MSLVLKILLGPSKALKAVMECSLRCSLKYALCLASIGSILSFVSLYVFEKEELQKVLMYSALIYVLDLLGVLLFGVYLSSLTNLKFKDALRISIFSSIPVWVSDIVDIYQPLRPLSTLGLFYSMYIIFLWLKELKIERAYLHIGVYTLLYILNALVSEAIFQNPVIKELLKEP